ncbi:MAG TPA: site-2 protease family protein [Thermoanaerobaculia bacterium]|nr:site-2 protease family protein [Thermoanaerobaculia bacterium]
MMDANLLFLGAIQLLLVLLSATIHEAAHARAAELLGDPTPRALGRVTLNPIAHLDFLGTVIVPAAVVALGLPVAFGWARPTPVVARNLRRPGWDSLRVTLAGPAANAAFALVAALALTIVVHVLGPEARQAAQLSLLGGTIRDPAAPVLAVRGFPILFTLAQAAVINGFLVVFHLLPFPPLDGGMVLLQVVPPGWVPRLAALRPYGFIIGAGLALSPLLWVLLIPFLVVLSVLINI